MKKINEFVNNEDVRLKIISLLDRFLFFDEEWIFPDNSDYISNILDDIIPVNDFIKIGQDLVKKLNDEHISHDSDNITDIIDSIYDNN